MRPIRAAALAATLLAALVVAAACATAAGSGATTEPPRVATAVAPSVDSVDIVVGEATADYGAFRSSHADEGEGVDMARWSPMPHRFRLGGTEQLVLLHIPGDPDAMSAALATPYARGRVVKGIIGSAFEFNREIDRLNWIRETYGVVSEDMESAFSAGAALGFVTPFLAIRIISDSEFYAPELQRIAGEYCAAFVVEVVKRIERPSGPGMIIDP